MMISDQDRASLGMKFSQAMVEEVTLLLFADGGTVLERELTDYVNMMASMSPKIKLDLQSPRDGKNERLRALRIEHTPVLVLTKGDFARIRYYGLPGGYELPSMVDAIIELSNAKTPLSPKAKVALSKIRRRSNIKVFVLQTCPFCPTVARHAHRGAIESQLVTSEVIDSQMFPDLAARHSVMGVPKIILNDNLDITGAVTDVEFFEKLKDSDISLIDSIYG